MERKVAAGKVHKLTSESAKSTLKLTTEDEFQFMDEKLERSTRPR